MAKVTIGGEDYNVEELSFAAIERAWPSITAVMLSADPVAASAAGLKIIAAALLEQEEFKGPLRDQVSAKMPALDGETNEDKVFEACVVMFKKKLKASEMGGVSLAVQKIIEEAELTDTGEDKAPAEGNLSTETAPDTSSSLSPPGSKEEAGTQ